MALKATLRSFQTEIEDIHSRELSKQRQQGIAAMAATKEPHRTKGKTKAEPPPIVEVKQEESLIHDTDLAEVEDKILVRV